MKQSKAKEFACPKCGREIAVAFIDIKELKSVECDKCGFDMVGKPVDPNVKAKK